MSCPLPSGMRGKRPGDGIRAAQQAGSTKPRELVCLMKSSRSAKILVAEIEKLFISPLKGKTSLLWRLFVLWGRNLTFARFRVSARWLGAGRCSQAGWMEECRCPPAHSLPPPGQVHQGTEVRHELELFLSTGHVFLVFTAALLKAALCCRQVVVQGCFSILIPRGTEPP